MDKISVNGKETHDVFKYLRSNTKELQSKQDPGAVLELPWNFCRWVVDKNGKVQMYMNPIVDLQASYEIIEHLLEIDKRRKAGGTF